LNRLLIAFEKRDIDFLSMTNTCSILVIDDEIQISSLLEIALSEWGYLVYKASTGKEGLDKAAFNKPDLILLDLGLPDYNGHEILSKLREWYQKPIIILSSRNSEKDIVEALDNGANDYITKPFNCGELLARIRAVIRQSQRLAENPCLSFGSLSIDIGKHIVRKNEKTIKLTAKEFSLLTIFSKNEGRVLTHQYILKEVWGMGYLDQTQYLRVFILNLRKKIEDDPGNPSLLHTESGIGYRFSTG
jgi:two-component system, OmpR family, KDP operon response regulator KdpE